MKGRLAALAAILAVLLLTVPTVMASDSTEADSASPHGGDFLIDMGNGDTRWYAVSSGSTYADVAVASAVTAGHTCTYSSPTFTVDGRTSTTIGSADNGGSYTQSGTTGYTVTSSWHLFRWDTSGSGAWVEVADCDAAYGSEALALAFQPSGVLPSETPEYKSSWTMQQGDASNSSNQSAIVGEVEGSAAFHKSSTEPAYGCYAPILAVENLLIAKFGRTAAGYGDLACVKAINSTTGEEVWSFNFPHNMDSELSGIALVGDYVYVQSSTGFLYKINWRTGPGTDNCDVTTLGGIAYTEDTSYAIPDETSSPPEHPAIYGQGPYTFVYDSGCLFLRHYSGMVYCFDLDLNLVWSRQMNGGCYYSAVTVTDGYVAAGAYDGHIYVMDETDGRIIDHTYVYTRADTVTSKDGDGNTVTSTVDHGSVNVPVFVKNGSGYMIFTTYSDGLIMDSTYSGLAYCSFDGENLGEVQYLDNEITGAVTTYVTRYVTDEFSGILLNCKNGTFSVSVGGEYALISKIAAGTYSSHSTPILVNNSTLFIDSYFGFLTFSVSVDGTNTRAATNVVKNYCMASPTVIDNLVVCPNDGGFTAVTGAFKEYQTPEEVIAADDSMPLWQTLLIVIVIIAAALTVFWLILRYVKHWEKPFEDLKRHVYIYFYGEDIRHNVKSKRRLYISLACGIALTATVFLLSLCVGDKTTVGPAEALGALSSAISKHGDGLNSLECLIYVNRMPRAMAALGAGLGLSVAGAMYQAVIKNPLVEPYIMGVSGGAGTLAIAVIVFDFTFFGLVGSDNGFLVAISAIFGGLLAFGITMILAKKTGGKSVNYVLAGIVVGLVFSAIQAIMIVVAGNEISSALGWMYGSFNSITWEEAWIILVPAIAMSFIPLFWAKEFNLVLLGEDQARQMGLDAKRFDSVMLILASILTAICVAFCGVIGFVGLVIPHLSRMILGGDHRLMLPLTMTLGGFMMILADLLARILVSGFELPVGAVTAMVGVPVFAYLLIKRGRSYDA